MHAFSRITHGSKPSEPSVTPEVKPPGSDGPGGGIKKPLVFKRPCGVKSCAAGAPLIERRTLWGVLLLDMFSNST